jgi:hypothetical protein
MSRNELTHIGDINHPVWREIYFSRMCSDLVINFVTPCFPILNKYFYIQNTDERIFDNPSQHEKFAHGEVAEDINRLLTEADRKTMAGKKEAANYINSKFFLLSRKINKATRYSRNNIQLIDVCMCLTMEHTGRTLRDIPILAENGTAKEDKYFLPFFTDYNVFRKHFFEYLYTFYAMNSKVGLIHGDLHLNNGTLYTNIFMDEYEKKNPRNVFVVKDGNKPRVYSFPHQGLYSMVIDLSRGIFSNKARLEKDFGKLYADLYMKEQNQRVKRILLHYFPVAVAKHRDKLDNILENNFEIMFRLLTLIDPYTVARNLETMFDADLRNYQHIKPDRNIVAFARRIAALCEVNFVARFNEIISGKLTEPDKFEWPCLTLIKELYAEDEVKTADDLRDATITDVFTTMNDLKYSIDKYDHMNELIKLDLEIRLRKKFGIDAQEDIDYVTQYKKDETDKRDVLVHKYEHEAPMMPEESSWMFE